MSKSKPKSNTMIKENMLNYIRIFLIASLVVIIFYPPYLQGLFFEKHVLPTQIIVFIVFIIFLIYKLLKNDNSFFKTPIEYISLGFVVVYFISIFVAVHTRSAIIEWLKYCMYFAVFYMVSDLADNLKVRLLFLWTIVISAVGVSIIGLDAALGGTLVTLLNKFFNAVGVQGNLFFGLFVDNRIHSTLQYPNALASYLMAVFFVTVGLLLVCDKWWQKSILGSFSFILFLTFMLTKSRGAQLLFPVAVIVLFIVSPKNDRIKVITHIILLVIPACLLSLFISPYLSSGTFNLKVILLLLSGVLFTVCLSQVVSFVGNFFQKINWKVYVAIISIFVVVMILGLIYLINASIPLELIHEVNADDTWKQVTRKYVLEPNKEYLISYEVETVMKKEQPYALYISIYSQDDDDILLGKQTLLYEESIKNTKGVEKKTISIKTPEDCKLITINFVNTYSGTSAKIASANIIDVNSSETVKKILLKNRYNLDDIIIRFQAIWLQQSVVSRIVFYKDGFDIFKDRWLLGAGGGAWNYLYRQYQSYNYASSQAHNYPLQLGIETGILGIAVLIGLVIIIIISYIKYYMKVQSNYTTASIITAVASLLLHAIIDFDFSESSMLLLFWLLLSLFNLELKESLAIGDDKLLFIVFNQDRPKYTIRKKRKSTLFIGISISIIATYFSLTFFIASSFAKQSFKDLQNNNVELAFNKMEKAITLDRYNEKYVIGYNPFPNRPDIKAGLADILFLKNEKFKKSEENGEDIPDTDLYLFQKQFSKVALYIKGIEKKAKNNLSLTSDLASFCFKTGEIDKGINYLNLAINYCPFEPSLWYSKINLFYQLLGSSFNNGEFEKAEEYLLKGLDVINEAMEVNKKNMNPFVFNQNSVEILQKMKFLKDNWNNDKIQDVNEVIHYSMFDLDINIDNMPDQWGISNTDLIISTNNGEDLSIQTSERVYIYTHYPIKLKKGNTYLIEIKTRENVDNLSYFISGVTPNPISLINDNNKYTAELFVKNETDESGNQLRIYLETDCVIESIIVMQKEKS